MIEIVTDGLPWWSSDSESACQCGGHGFDPWWEDSTGLGAAKPVCITTEPVSLRLRSATREVTAVRLLRATARE